MACDDFRFANLGRLVDNVLIVEWGYEPTVDAAPPKIPRNDYSPVNTSKYWFFMVSKWCKILSIHSANPLGGFTAWA